DVPPRDRLLERAPQNGVHNLPRSPWHATLLQHRVQTLNLHWVELLQLLVRDDRLNVQTDDAVVANARALADCARAHCAAEPFIEKVADSDLGRLQRRAVANLNLKSAQHVAHFFARCAIHPSAFAMAAHVDAERDAGAPTAVSPLEDRA